MKSGITAHWTTIVLLSMALSGCDRSPNPRDDTNQRASSDRPNIVFIMLDNVGYANIGCYGSKVIKTPNIDKLAKQGMRFTQAYSGSNVCAPSRCALMTGYHGGHIGLRSNTGGVPLANADVTIAEVLKEAGYATGGFGKWGLGDIKTEGAAELQGFDTFFGYYHHIHAHDYYPEYLIKDGTKVKIPENTRGKKRTLSHHLIFKETLDFIRANKDRPFFCYAPWNPPHVGMSYPPWVPGMPDDQLLPGKQNLDDVPKDDPAWKLYQDKAWHKVAKNHAAFISMMDRNIGHLMDLLHELKIDRNTIVFFTSDNGAPTNLDEWLHSSGGLRGGMGTFYEGGIRVPLIARWPDHVAANTQSKHLCYFPDIMPTVAQLAGVSDQVPADIDGISFLPELLGKTQPIHEYLYWDCQRFWTSGVKRNIDGSRYQFYTKTEAPIPGFFQQAVRFGDWKLVRHRDDQAWELYDLSHELGETKNLASEQPEMLKKLIEYATHSHREARPQKDPSPPKGQMFR